MATFYVDILFGYVMIWWTLCSQWLDSFLHEGRERWSKMYKPFPAWISYTIFSHLLNLPLILFTYDWRNRSGWKYATPLLRQNEHVVCCNLIIVVMVKVKLSSTNQCSENQAGWDLLVSFAEWEIPWYQ